MILNFKAVVVHLVAMALLMVVTIFKWADELITAAPNPIIDEI